MVKDNIIIEGGKICFRNFSGKEGKFNPEGTRNFCALLDTDLALRLEEDGWNVRWLDPKDPDGEKQASLSVAVSYRNIPPKIVLVTGKGKNIRKSVLDEATVSLLDWAEIQNVDLVIRPYNWAIQEGTRNEKRGVKAYVNQMYVTIVEDEFEAKYNDVPDSAAATIGGCGHCETCDGTCNCHGD